MSYHMHIHSPADAETTLTLKVVGEAEMFRYAYYLAHGPVDTLHLATRAFRYLHRKWGHEIFVEHDKRITGGQVVKYGWHKRPKREDGCD